MDYFTDDKLLRGEEISPSLLTTIKESTISIIILSENYASSSGCLEELSKILECKDTKGQIVVPILDPSYVRNQKGKSFEKAFAKHQERFKDRTGKVERWRAAFKEVCNLSETHIHGQPKYSKDKVVSQYIHEICEYIVSKSTRSPPGPNGLPDGEEMLHQDSLKHQLVGETHAMNDGESVLSDGGIHSAASYPENEGTGTTIKRKRGRSKIQIPPEDLLTFSGTVKDAGKHLNVSKSTIKRRCREHGITNWQYRTIDNNSQFLSQPKDTNESTQGEGAEMGNQMAGGSEYREREVSHEQFGFPPESEKSLDMSQCVQASGELLKDDNISAIVAFNTEQVPESSRTNLSCSIPVPEATAAHMMPLVTEMQDARTVTIKATYGDEKIKFHLPLTSGIIELRKKVAERLTLEVGTFSIKYLDDDDDDDYISLTVDKDLQDYLENSVLLGRKVMKLWIHDKRVAKGN